MKPVTISIVVSSQEQHIYIYNSEECWDNGAFKFNWGTVVIMAAYLLLILPVLRAASLSSSLSLEMKNYIWNNKHSIVCIVWLLFPRHISIISYGVTWDPLASPQWSHTEIPSPRHYVSQLSSADKMKGRFYSVEPRQSCSGRRFFLQPINSLLTTYCTIKSEIVDLHQTLVPL